MSGEPALLYPVWMAHLQYAHKDPEGKTASHTALPSPTYLQKRPTPSATSRILLFSGGSAVR